MRITRMNILIIGIVIYLVIGIVYATKWALTYDAQKTSYPNSVSSFAINTGIWPLNLYASFNRQDMKSIHTTEISGTNETEVVTTAEKAIEKNNPEWVAETKTRAVVESKNDLWIVSWELAGSHDGRILGGSPVVEISKTTGEVVRVYHTQ